MHGSATVLHMYVRICYSGRKLTHSAWYMYMHVGTCMYVDILASESSPIFGNPHYHAYSIQLGLIITV